MFLMSETLAKYDAPYDALICRVCSLGELFLIGGASSFTAPPAEICFWL
jgi:hypothetical protein